MQKTSHQDVLSRLVHDLQTKTTLCRVKDYPGVELEQLNNYVVEFRPLVNPVFGDQAAFFIDEGRFIPYRMNVYGNAIVVNEIIWQVGNWSKLSGERGRTTASRGTFISGTDIRMPDVAYTPRDLHRDYSTESVWMYRGERYTPTFAVEVDKLSGPGSRLSTLDRKMRTEYFENGVQLGWLIGPRPDCHKMYEYYLDNDNQVQCSGNSEWRDLDGGDVLPGFKLESIDLDMVLSQDSGSSSEEEVDFTCPERGCGHQFNTRSKFIAHAQWHGAESARQRYLAKQNL